MKLTKHHHVGWLRGDDYSSAVRAFLGFISKIVATP
jgi:hypothetical protein